MAAPDHVHSPGWNSTASGDPYSSCGYTLNQNGKLVSYGGETDDHIADVLAGLADDFLRRSATDPQPFFV